MKRFLFLIAVLLLNGTYSIYGQKPMEEDPNVMWTYGGSFSTYPAIHPNGNVLIASGLEVLEINGLTGLLVRKIPLPAPTSSLILSKDGSRMAASGYIIDVETGAVITAHPRAAAVRFLHPSNSKVIYTLFNQKDTSWVVWDMENDTYKNYQLPHLVTSIDVSNDGRFLAVASKETSLPINEQRTHFYLYNAQTMQLIRELENVLAEGRTIEFIQFSENAKYVGYGNNGGTPKATYFTCEPPYSKWEFSDANNPIAGKSCIGFINESHLFLSSYGINSSVGVIYDINNEKEIFYSNLYSSRTPQFNILHNSMITDYYFLTEAGQIIRRLFSLDFNKILNSVSVDEPKEPGQNIITEYRNGILMISGIESNSPIINITISDTLGNIMFNNQIQSMNGRIELAVPLPSGVYILQIRDGNNNYSQKFIVTR